MSELRVWVDDKERVIRGVSDDTTCESVLIALAKAAGKSGRVALLEKWRDMERILPRTEKPIKCLQMWGNLRDEVQFFLRDDTTSQSITDIEKYPSIDSAIDNEISDPIKRSLDSKSLEAAAVNQASKISRLARATEILDTQLACWNENEEASLYYTEDEISEELSSKLSEILKLQERELKDFTTAKIEFDKLKETQKKLIANIESFREKINSVEHRITDLDSTGAKLFTQLEHLADRDLSARHKDLNQVNSLVENDELRALRLELNKQKALSDRQSLELENVARSVQKMSKKVDQRTTKVAALENELYPSDVYYDLDENFLSTSPEKYDELDDPVQTLKEIKDNVDFIGRTGKEQRQLTNGHGSGSFDSRSDDDCGESITKPLHNNKELTPHLQLRNIPTSNGITHYTVSEEDVNSIQRVEYVDVSITAKGTSPARSDGTSRNAKYLLPPATRNKERHKQKRVPIIENDLCDHGVFV